MSSKYSRYVSQIAKLIHAGAGLGHVLLGRLDARDLGLARLFGIHLRLLEAQLGLVQRSLSLHKRLVVLRAQRVVNLVGRRFPLRCWWSRVGPGCGRYPEYTTSPILPWHRRPAPG